MVTALAQDRVACHGPGKCPDPGEGYGSGQAEGLPGGDSLYRSGVRAPAGLLHRFAETRSDPPIRSRP